MKIIFDELKAAWDEEDISYFEAISEPYNYDGVIYYDRTELHNWIKRRTNKWEEICGRRIQSPFLCALIHKKYKLAAIFSEDFDDDYFGEIKIINYLAYPWYQEQQDWIKANTTLFRHKRDFWRMIETNCKKYAELYDWDDECFFDKNSQKDDFLE